MQEQFIKRSGINKLWLKLTNRQDYKRYKAENYIHAISEKLTRFSANYPLFNRDTILEAAAASGAVRFAHSGNAGDIIYALPTIKEISTITGKPVHLFLKLGKSLDILAHYKHPLGNVMLNQDMADRLIPLLKGQSYIADCTVFTSQEIDIDLDTLKLTGLSFDRGNIAAWYNYITGLQPDLSQAWLHAVPAHTLQETIVVARSSRYTNPAIDYSFLRDYPSVAFIGVKSEYEAFKNYVPALKWLPVDNFMQLAEILSGCKFFIGNQSFPYSVAEGLKIPRLLETAIDAPNVLPEGGRCYGFYFQEHLEWYVKEWAAGSVPGNS